MSARSLNRIDIIGNIGDNPKLNHTSGGAAVCTFRMATNREWTSGETGERQESTQWHGIVVFGKFGELCNRIIKKGQKVFITGRIKYDKMTNQDGGEYTKTEIVAEEVIILDNDQRGDNNKDRGYVEDDFDYSEYLSE